MTSPLAIRSFVTGQELARVRAAHAIERAQFRHRIDVLERALADAAPADTAARSVDRPAEFPTGGFEPSAHFADAWAGEDSSTEERSAAQSFFQHEGLDERARRWFLRDL